MKNFLLYFVITLSLLGVAPNLFAAGTIYKVDAAKSLLTWTGKKVTGQHTGNIKVKSGSITMFGKAIKAGEIIVDMTSITDTDLTDPEWNGKLITHLKSNDFFAVDKFKEAKLVIKDAQFGKGGIYNIIADLIIKGKSHPVKFDADLNIEDEILTGIIEFTFDRTRYDIKYGSGKFFKSLGDKMINDEVSVKADIHAKI